MAAELRQTDLTTVVESDRAALLPRGHTVLFSLVTVVFILWGVANSFNHILIQQFMKLFALSRVQASVIQSAYYFGYALPAIPAALCMQRSGYKFTLLFGLMLFSAGSVCFWPAAIAGKFPWFIVALFILASGVSFLETSAGTFVQQMGDRGSATRRVNLSQAFQSLGAVAGGLAGTRFILSGIEYNSSQRLDFMVAQGRYFSAESHRVIGPYMCLSVFSLLLALVLHRQIFPPVGGASSISLIGDFRILACDRGFLAAWIAAFLYFGAQVGTWSFLFQYVQQFTSSHEKLAGHLLAGTLGAFGIGRFASVFVMRLVSAQRLLMAYSATNCVLLVTAMIRPGWIGVWAIMGSSFFMSIMYPTIFSFGVAGHGEQVRLAGALMVTAISAGGIVPPLMAVISRHTGSFASAYALPLISYGCICLFARLSYRRDEYVSC
jgi:MFS transporter, FHS family, L-fucose permease